MTRMPQIGDSVRRVVDGNVEFEGYVFAHSEETNAMTVVVPMGAKWEQAGTNPPSAITDEMRAVPTYYLVRALDGWQWAPWDGRPQVGDAVIIGRTMVALPRSRWLVLSEGKPAPYPVPWGIVHPETLERIELNDREIAQVIAGIDGWSWEPARWSGGGK